MNSGARKTPVLVIPPLAIVEEPKMKRLGFLSTSRYLAAEYLKVDAGVVGAIIYGRPGEHLPGSGSIPDGAAVG